MGYSLSVRFPSSTAAAQALDFLSAVDWEATGQQQPRWAFTAPAGGSGLSYPPRVDPSLLVGFNHSCINRLEWAVMVWLACKSSYRNTAGNPVVYYDDEPLCIVHARLPHPGEEHRIRANALGFKENTPSPWWERLFQRKEQKDLGVILQSLEDRWATSQVLTAVAPEPVPALAPNPAPSSEPGIHGKRRPPGR